MSVIATERQRLPRIGRPGRRGLIAILVIAAFAVSAVLSNVNWDAGSIGTTTRDVASGGGGAPASTGASTEAFAPAADGATAVPVPAGATPDSTISVGQRISQTATIAVRVKADVNATLDRAGQIVQAAGGYIVSTNSIGAAGRAPDSGTITIRVPSERFAQTMRALSGLGTELSRQVASEDLTQEYVDTKSRLRNNHAVETRLLALLDRAAGVNDVLAVQDRLAAVQEQIETDQGRLDYLTKITTFSTITLDVSTPAHVAAKKPTANGDDWGIGRAWSRGAHLFVNTINGLVIALGAALPIVGIAGLVGLVAVRRRRRPTPVTPQA